MATPSTFNSGDVKLLAGAEPLIEGLEHLGRGSSRSVYALNDEYVLKVARQKTNYYGDNLSELALWEQVEEDDQQYFGRIFAADTEAGRWLVMERCMGDSTFGIHDCNVSRRLASIADKYKIRDVSFHNCMERKNGSVCIIDYAYNRLLQQ